LEAQCECPPPPIEFLPASKQRAGVSVEKRKGGRKVTVIRGLAAEETDLPELLGKLKMACGAGGTIKDQQIEIQGDHRDTVKTFLSTLGYQLQS
jgi:translation initiation factor 1